MAPGLNQALAQSLIHLQPVDPGWSRRWSRFLKHLLPELSRGIQQDFTVLKQATVLSALGAANPFDAAWIHQVGNRCRGETVVGFSTRRIGTEVQR